MEPLIELDYYQEPPFFKRIFWSIEHFIKNTIYRLLKFNFRLSLLLLRKFQGPSNLVEHARREFEIAGWFDDVEDDFDINRMMAEDIMELLEVFANQGHSGFSGSYAVSLFKRLGSYDIISPLTGEPDEWNDISDHYGRTEKVYQNRRKSTVFKDENGSYDIEGRIFVEPNGGAYTSGDSRIPVEFPYVPKRTYVYVDENGVPTGEEKVVDG